MFQNGIVLCSRSHLLATALQSGACSVLHCLDPSRDWRKRGAAIGVPCSPKAALDLGTVLESARNTGTHGVVR